VKRQRSRVDAPAMRSLPADTAKGIEMHHLFFDTETTGFPKPWMPWDHPDQPYIVQLAAMLCDDSGNVLNSINFIINNGVDIPKVCSDIHGITREKAESFGVKPDVAITPFMDMLAMSGQIVAHNVKFDVQMMDLSLARRKGSPNPMNSKTFCTMEAAKPVVKCPPTEKMKTAGNNSFKAPKLEECIRFFFNEPLDGAHDAMVDVIGCKRVFFKLREAA
jgi:DNA polymerase III, epsilon subunit and related 3''-5'' exonucleases